MAVRKVTSGLGRSVLVMFEGFGVPWGWFAGLVVFGLIATSLYIAAVRAPRGRRATAVVWFVLTASVALVCLIAVVVITIMPVLGLAVVVR